MTALVVLSHRVRRSVLAATLAVATLLPVAVPAATINFVTPAKNANNTGDYSQTAPRREFRSEVVLQSTDASSFCVRYASVLAVDVAAGGNTETESVTSSYRISFDVITNPMDPTDEWTIKLVSTRRGAYTIIDDNGRHGTARITSSITATSSTGNSLAVLGFAGANHTNSGSPGSNLIAGFDQSGEAIITGNGDASVVLNFTWTSSVTSDPDGFPFGGDEAAVRLGLSTIGINRITAGDYEALNDRVKADDGHFVCATVCPAPAVTVTDANFCAPLSGAPCTFTACGTVVGCLESNYTVALTYLNRFGQFVTNDFVSVTDGDPNWCTSVEIPGPCTDYPYSIVASVIDNPGLVLADVSQEYLADLHERSGTHAAVTTDETCGPIPGLPSTAAWGRVAVGVLVLAAGTFGILRRRRAGVAS